jgi:hypothetical protein
LIEAALESAENAGKTKRMEASIVTDELGKRRRSDKGMKTKGLRERYTGMEEQKKPVKSWPQAAICN